MENFLADFQNNMTYMYYSNETNLTEEVTTMPPDMSGCSQGDINSDPLLKGFYYAYGRAHGYVSVLVSIFGILANIANIVVLTRKNMLSSVNLILMWLAAADLLTMVVYLPFSVHFYILRDHSLIPLGTHSKHWSIYMLIFSHASIVCHTYAIWLTINLAVFRVLYVLLPTRGPQMCTITRAKIAVVATCAAVTIMAIPNYLCNGIVEMMCEEQTVFTVMYSQLALQNPNLIHMNFWIQATFFKLVPCAILTILTVLLIHAMNQANQRRMKLKSQGRKEESNRHQETNRTTGMLLAVVVLFLITELPQGIFTVLSGVDEDFFLRIYTPLGDLMDILALLNNSVNFVLYCAMSRQFRTTFMNIFCKWLPKQPECCKRHGYQEQKTNGVSSDMTTQSTEMTKMLSHNNNA